MYVHVFWAPETGEFHDMGIKAQPISTLQPLFEGAENGQTMKAEVERALREGQVLIQYVTTNMALESVYTSIAWTLSKARGGGKSAKLEKKLEKKCYAAGPPAKDRLFQPVMNQGYDRIRARQALDLQAIQKGMYYK